MNRWCVFELLVPWHLRRFLWLGLLFLLACSSSGSSGRSWVVEESHDSGNSLYSFPNGTAIRVEDDALVLSYRNAERRIPARVTRDGSEAVIEVGSDEQPTRMMLKRSQEGHMELVREGLYRLKLKGAER